MASDRLDRITRLIAKIGTRRALLGTLTGGGLLLANLTLGVEDLAEAAKRKRKSRRKKNKDKKKNPKDKCPKKRRCGKRCCKSGKTCKGGTCQTTQQTPRPTRTPDPSDPTSTPNPDATSTPEPTVTPESTATPEPTSTPDTDPPPPGVRVRRDMHDNPGVLDAYATAVGVMKARPSNDPTSWMFQANIHANSCEHGSVLFLSWHRMYLYWFERIVRAASGDPDFALPYWNYGSSNNRTVPAPFLNPSNPLYNDTRALGPNGELDPPGTLDYTASGAMGLTNFYAPSAMNPSFGGGNSNGGRVEVSPHNPIHTTIGGNMGQVGFAGRDPLFWVHHANIDRLWVAWLAQGGGRTNPTDVDAFMNTQFTFWNENGQQRQMRGSEILDTVGQLGYRYDDQSVSGLGAGRMRARAGSSKRQPKQRIIGTTSRSNQIRLGTEPVTTAVKVKGSDRKGRPLTLTIEDLTGEAVSTVLFEVYVNKGNGPAKSNSQSFVGTFSLFGVQPGDMPNMSNGSMSVDFNLDITKAVAASDDGGKIEVTIVPTNLRGTDSGTLATIGRLIVTVAGANKSSSQPNNRKKKARSGDAKKQRQDAKQRQRTANPKRKRGAKKQAVSQPGASTSEVILVPGNKTSALNVDTPGDELAVDAHAVH